VSVKRPTWAGQLITNTAPEWSRRRIWVYEIFMLCVLWTFAGLHLSGALVWPEQFGTIPIGVPFFGALGGVLVSLSATSDFRGKFWDPSWEAWHYTRWLIGGTVGIVGVLIFQAGILATGLQIPDNNDTTGQATDKTNLAYYVIAFGIGYREETFRELVRRLVEVILSPGEKTPPSVSAVTSVKFGGSEASLSGGQRSDTSVVVTTPAAQKPGKVPVTVETKDGSDATETFEYF
jgi:hypothetical protein